MAGEPVRVLATWNRRPLPGPVPVAANTRLVEWLSYARTMPGCALVICHAGHGTMVRALACGCRVLAVPHVGDMAENAARVDWAGAGVRLPWPLLSPVTLRLAVRRALGGPSWGTARRSSARGRRSHPGPARAADLVEQLAARADSAAWRLPSPRDRRLRCFARRGYESSGGGTRTHNISVNSRTLCH